MKRRSSHTLSKDPSMPPYQSIDSGCSKRVKFKDLDNDNPSNHPTVASSKALKGFRADDPKTSEYAFFKKFKENTGHGFHSHSMAEDKQSKFKSSDLTRERTNMVKKSYKDLQSLLALENVRPINLDSFLSPVGRSSKNSEVDLKGPSTTFENKWSIEKNTKECGNSLSPTDVFSRKRKKLRQWVSDISFPGIDELCSKGYDVVSMLLSRLFLENYEDNFKTSKSGKVENDTNLKLLASPRTDIHLKELHLMPTRNLMENDDEPYLMDQKRRLLPNLDSPTCHADVSCLLYTLREPYCDFRQRRNACDEFDSSFGFSFNYGLSSWGHVKELDYFHEPNEYLIEREPCPFLLEWESDNVTNEKNVFTCQTTELIPYPMLPTLSQDNRQSNLDNGFCKSGLHMPSITSGYPSNLYALSQSHSACYQNQDFSRHVPEDKEEVFKDPNHFPLALARKTNCLILDGDCDLDTTLEGSSIFISLQDRLGFMSKVFREQHNHSGMGGFFLSSALEFDSGFNCLPIIDPSWEPQSYINNAIQFPQKEGTFSHFLSNGEYERYLNDSVHRNTIRHYNDDDILENNKQSSFYFPTFPDREKQFPMLLDKSSRRGSEQEFSADPSYFH